MYIERFQAFIDANQTNLTNMALKPLLILISGLILVRVSTLLINKLAQAELGRSNGERLHKQRETIIGLLKNIVKYVIYFVMIITILDSFSVPVMTILSAAGVLGIALAFGAQTLCRDIITGAFILMEGQFFVGEYIEAQGVAGYVEQFTLRCTYIRDFDGRLHILPNGCMSLVSNHYRGTSRIWVEVIVPYEFSIEAAIGVLKGACEMINDEFKGTLKENLWVMGTSALTPTGALLRVMGMSEPMRHWEIERAFRKRAMEMLLAAGMAAPYTATRVKMDEKADIYSEKC